VALASVEEPELSRVEWPFDFFPSREEPPDSLSLADSSEVPLLGEACRPDEECLFPLGDSPLSADVLRPEREEGLALAPVVASDSLPVAPPAGEAPVLVDEVPVALLGELPVPGELPVALVGELPVFGELPIAGDVPVAGELPVDGEALP
jgi:hypothetical protein